MPLWQWLCFCAVSLCYSITHHACVTAFCNRVSCKFIPGPCLGASVEAFFLDPSDLCPMPSTPPSPSQHFPFGCPFLCLFPLPDPLLPLRVLISPTNSKSSLSNLSIPLTAFPPLAVRSQFPPFPLFLFFNIALLFTAESPGSRSSMNSSLPLESSKR